MSKWFYVLVMVASICFYQSACGQDSITYSNKKKIEELRSRIDKLYAMENNCDSLAFKLKQVLNQQQDSIRLLTAKLNAGVNSSESSLIGGNSKRIYYDLENVKANYSAYPFLDSIASFIKKDPLLTIKLVGHADRTGTEAFNQQLSLRRAESLKSYLLNKYHLASDKIITEGHGSQEPINEITDPYLFHLNRRVEVILLSSPSAHLVISE